MNPQDKEEASKDPHGELDALARRRLGCVLRGKYRLDSVLGVGGMAAVYKATHRNQAEFAVKMLHPQLSMLQDVRERFLREGYSANSVKHPGVVHVVDDDVDDDGAAFLVMELLEGMEVEAYWRAHGRRLMPFEAASIVVQLLDVLEAAHGKGIVHRDIKPANLFLTRDGTLKVLDFGIARARDALGGGGHVTGTGMTLGTPAFMAPEQVLGKRGGVDGRADVWSAGATLFTLLSGACVHDGETASQLMVLSATTPARPLGTVAPSVPTNIADVVDRALAFDVNVRWPSAAAMRDALIAACLSSLNRTPGKVLPETSAAPVVSRPAGSIDSVAMFASTHMAEGVMARSAEARSMPSFPSTTAVPISTERVPPSPAPASTPALFWVATAAVALGAVALVANLRAVRPHGLSSGDAAGATSVTPFTAPSPSASVGSPAPSSSSAPSSSVVAPPPRPAPSSTPAPAHPKAPTPHGKTNPLDLPFK